MKIKLKVLLIFISIFLLNACATYNLQYKDAYRVTSISDEDIEHSFYLIGDGGNSPIGSKSKALSYFSKVLENAKKQSTAVFLGDNIYPSGLPKKDNKLRELAEHQLDVQIDALKNFKGETLFIPGNHDWYSNGLKGLKRQEKYIEDKLGKNTFLPENGCPLEKIDVTDNIVMIIIDSEWYLTNWDKHPTINDDCEIKTRAKFFDEFEGLIKKARGKTTLITVHHPMFTNGAHGGQYSLKQQIFPLNNKVPMPVVGSLVNLIRKTSGISPADLQNKRYIEFKKRLVALSKENDKAIFISGHDHSLQYLEQDNTRQIISGSGSKTTPTRTIDGGQFSYGAQGYSRLDVLKNGSVFVRFYSAEDQKMIFQKEILLSNDFIMKSEYDTEFPSHTSASIYSEDETTKGAVYKILWGKRYRAYYNTKVNVPVVSLDTLLGGLTPVRKGGGHQSNSLRLQDINGKEYVMRALRKNAVRYIQSTAFKDQYIEEQFNDTYTEGLILDVFTGSHPYAPFTIPTMSKALDIFHTNPKIYYVPKQNSLGYFNEDFGDELYMIEERAASGHGDKESFGFSNKVISTDDMFKNLRKDEKYKVDEKAYIRARLFDMLIGDWDRHEDQWRWAEFKNDGEIIYKPIPRDRDQAFSIMASGTLLSVGTTLVPALRLLRSYKEDLKSPKWFNLEPYPLDMALINRADKTFWDEQVKHIQDHLTDEIIDLAFTYFPSEVNDETIREIMLKLKGRRKNLQKISDKYFKHVNKFAVVKGTDKDDWFEVERLQNGQTKVTGFRIKNGKKGNIFHQRTYNREITKEIWIYGLDDEDTFNVIGNGSNEIKIVLIGGQNKDTYTIENGKKVRMYDFLSKENEFESNNGRKKLTNDYETNVYDYKKLKNNANQLIPSVGSNPDDGFKLGFTDTFTIYGFERNPFTSQHSLSASYYFATNGFDLAYKGEFARIIGDFNLGIASKYTSSNYARNFFGYGNESPNPEADSNDGLDVELDYNRVKIKTFKISPSLIWRGQLGAIFNIGLSFENNVVEKTAGRFINQFIGNSIDVNNNFVGVNAKYHFANSDNKAYPTLGMETSLELGYTSNLDGFNGFGYVIPSIGFTHKLLPSGHLVLATKFNGHVTLGNGFQFYQAATLGANNGLRGYRNERFTGKNAFYQSTDLRLSLRKVKTGLLPLYIGVYGGIDYGRVWIPNEVSKKWNNSVGLGFFANAADMFTANISAFNSSDGLRLAFKLGFGF